MVKLLVNFDHVGNPVPYDHQYYVYSSVIRNLGALDPDSAKVVHEKKKFPLFVMSQLIPSGDRKFMKDGISSDRFVLIFVSASDAILSSIVKSFVNSGGLELGNGTVLKYHSSSVVPVTIPGPFPQLVTRSPVIIRQEGRFLSFGDEGFLEAMKSSIIRKADAITGHPGHAISVLKIMEGKRKAFTVHGAKVPASFLKFVMSADEGVTETALNFGVGSKTQIGFGMIEVSE